MFELDSASDERKFEVDARGIRTKSAKLSLPDLLMTNELALASFDLVTEKL